MLSTTRAVCKKEAVWQSTYLWNESQTGYGRLNDYPTRLLWRGLFNSMEIRTTGVVVVGVTTTRKDYSNEILKWNSPCIWIELPLPLKNTTLLNRSKCVPNCINIYPKWIELFITAYALVESRLLRTDNCESFHLKLNDMCYKAHPTIYQFMEFLNFVQNCTYLKLPSTTKIKTNILNKNHQIGDKVLWYNENQISRLEFVKLLSHKFNPVI